MQSVCGGRHKGSNGADRGIAAFVRRRFYSGDTKSCADSSPLETAFATGRRPFPATTPEADAAPEVQE
jgi:hypothetical protein